jgi:RNA-directed DNA polymerase
MVGKKSAAGIVGLISRRPKPLTQGRKSIFVKQRSEKFHFDEKLLAANGQDVIQSNEQEAASVSQAKSSPESLPSELMEKVCSRDNLNKAFQRVKSNRGSAGVDQMTVDQLGPWVSANKSELINSLLDGSFVPQPVKLVEIPKPDGGVRSLGIPTVVDRLVQQAILQVLTPIFDPQFSSSSFGFRPGRSAHDAIKQAQSYVKLGKRFVVDIDLEKFFDKVNHDMLMARIAKHIADKRVLRIIRRFLEAGIMSNGVTVSREEGTPQGGPLSPLLSNILLDDLDKELTRRNHSFCRYADDCNTYVSSLAAANRCLKSITRWIENHLKLKVNASKSAADNCGKRKFLGHVITKNMMFVSKPSYSRLEKRLRDLTRRKSPHSIEERVIKINQLLRGWINYYKMCSCRKRLQNLDEWLRRRMRSLKLHQLKRVYPRVKFLTSLGVSPKEAWKTCKSGKGLWRLSLTPAVNMGMTVEWFNQLGMLSFSKQYDAVKC